MTKEVFKMKDLCHCKSNKRLDFPARPFMRCQLKNIKCTDNKVQFYSYYIQWHMSMANDLRPIQKGKCTIGYKRPGQDVLSRTYKMEHLTWDVAGHGPVALR